MIFPGHEYAISNLQFAQTLLQNPVLDDVIVECEKNFSQGIVNVPSSLEREMQINPFLRVHDVQNFKNISFIDHAQYESPVTRLSRLRKLKDGF